MLKCRDKEAHRSRKSRTSGRQFSAVKSKHAQAGAARGGLTLEKKRRISRRGEDASQPACGREGRGKRRKSKELTSRHSRVAIAAVCTGRRSQFEEPREEIRTTGKGGKSARIDRF